jgi:hypothetical protein
VGGAVRGLGSKGSFGNNSRSRAGEVGGFGAAVGLTAAAGRVTALRGPALVVFDPYLSQLEMRF